MKETCNCGEKRVNENSQEKVEINMSDIYTVSSLDSKKVTDYLRSFSQTRMEVKDSLKCLYHLKHKCEKKQKLYRNMKPYSRNKHQEDHLESTSSKHSLIHSQSLIPYWKETEKREIKHTDSKKYLKIINSNGSTTKITLKPVVLMHVQEMLPPPSKLNNKEIYLLNSTTSSQSSYQLNADATVPPETSAKYLREDCESQSCSNSKILRVKSSHNSTDLSSERELSCMKMSKSFFVTPNNLRMQNSHHNGGSCVRKLSSINFPPSPNVCYHDYSSNPGYVDTCLEKLREKTNIARVPANEYVKYDHPRVNYSTTTVFRHDITRVPSNKYVKHDRPRATYSTTTVYRHSGPSFSSASIEYIPVDNPSVPNCPVCK